MLVKLWLVEKWIVEKGICDKGFIWNLSNCKCQYDKSCNVREHLDYKNCKCRKNFVDKLVEECRENIDEEELHPTELRSNKIIHNSSLNDYEKICNSITLYVVLLAVFFITSISINSVFIYFNWYVKWKYIEARTFGCNYTECNPI